MVWLHLSQREIVAFLAQMSFPVSIWFLFKEKIDCFKILKHVYVMYLSTRWDWQEFCAKGDPNFVSFWLL